jgi:hypothetical protein
MKKVLVASILGLAATAVSSYGQGSIAFNTYSSVGYGPAKWTTTVNEAPAGDAGLQVSQLGFTADLLYSDSAGSGDTYISGSGGADLTVNAGVTLSTVAITPGYGPGFIIGPAVQFAYTSGSVLFTIDVFQGASYAAASAPGSGLGYGTVSWTELAGAIATGESPVGNFAAFPSSGITVQLSTIPEPTTLAILGLGAAGLLALRRRKA